MQDKNLPKDNVYFYVLTNFTKYQNNPNSGVIIAFGKCLTSWRSGNWMAHGSN